MNTNGIIHVLKSVPESLKIELSALADRHRRDYWRVGDVTNEIVVLVKERPDVYPDVGEMEVYKAVATMLNQEYSSRTVRDYAGLAAFFNSEIRQEYDLLPFSHFRYARSFGDRWAEVLGYSLAVAHENDRPPSVEFLEMKFQPPIEMPEYDENEQPMQSYSSDTDMVDGMTVSKALGIIRRGLKTFQLPDHVHDTAESLLDELEGILQPMLDKMLSIG
jgi:hypothetical protein